MRCTEFMTEIQRRLDRGEKDYEFALWILDTLVAYSDTFELENPMLSEALNRNLPDICAPLDLGEESEDFRRALTREMARLRTLVPRF